MLRNAQLVSVSTSDSIRLQGIFSPATSEPQVSLDAALLTHAVAGNFYNSRLLNHIALALNDLGMDVLVGNNRGHDVVNYVSTVSARRKIGAAYETVAECTYDIKAWVDLLANRGKKKILLVGHSLGAIKSLYSLAHAQTPGVRAAAALSPVRLSHRLLMQSAIADRFAETFQRANQLLSDGNGDRLFETAIPYPLLISARTFVDKYGPNDRYDWLPFLHKIAIPIWMAFGEKEVRPGHPLHEIEQQVQDRLKATGIESRFVETNIIAGANHYYSGRMVAASERLCDWLLTRFSLDG